MTITYVQANNILASNFGNATLSTFTSLYIGLSKTAPQRDGTGITEPTAASYARTVIDNTPTVSWQQKPLNPGVYENKIQFTFVESAQEWAGTADPITHIFLASSPTATGTAILYYATLTVSRPVPADTTIYFPIAALSISLT